MPLRSIPETIENRWDVLYAEYPEVYDRFARMPYRPSIAAVLDEQFSLAGKTIADIGAGTGLSTLALARYAAQVIGVEPEPAMRQLAERAVVEQGVTNARFIPGSGQEIPLPDRAVEAVTALTMGGLHERSNIAAFVREAERIVRPGGHVLIVEVARGWYGGELAPILFRDTWQQEFDYIKELVLPRYGYRWLTFTNTQDFGTVEAAVQTYGFIFGRAAIDYLKEHRQTTIQWWWSVFYRQVP